MNSTRLHFSLRSFLLIVLLIAAAFAVARINAEWLASLCYSVFLFVQCTAIVGAVFRTGTARVFWLSIVVFGFGYGLSAFPTERSQPYWAPGLYRSSRNTVMYPPVGPAYLVDQLFQLIEPSAKVGDEVMAQWRTSGLYPAVIQEIGINQQILVAWADGTPPSWVTNIAIENVHGRNAGHAIVAILVGLISASICQPLFRPNEMTDDRQSSIMSDRRD